jgi:hypothetical protein
MDGLRRSPAAAHDARWSDTHLAGSSKATDTGAYAAAARGLPRSGGAMAASSSRADSGGAPPPDDEQMVRDYLYALQLSEEENALVLGEVDRRDAAADDDDDAGVDLWRRPVVDPPRVGESRAVSTADWSRRAVEHRASSGDALRSRPAVMAPTSGAQLRGYAADVSPAGFGQDDRAHLGAGREYSSARDFAGVRAITAAAAPRHSPAAAAATPKRPGPLLEAALSPRVPQMTNAERVAAVRREASARSRAAVSISSSAGAGHRSGDVIGGGSAAQYDAASFEFGAGAAPRASHRLPDRR